VAAPEGLGQSKPDALLFDVLLLVRTSGAASGKCKNHQGCHVDVCPTSSYSLFIQCDETARDRKVEQAVFGGRVLTPCVKPHRRQGRPRAFWLFWIPVTEANSVWYMTAFQAVCDARDLPGYPLKAEVVNPGILPAPGSLV
jgi:hypothetical protein